MTPRRPRPCAIWRRGSFPSIRTPTPTAISRIYRRCKWSRATTPPRRCRGSPCAIGGGARRPAGRSRELIFDLYARARAVEAENRVPFAEGFTEAYRDIVPRLNDQDAFAVTQWLGTSPGVYRYALQKAFEQQRAEDSIGQTEAVALVWAYLFYDAYRSFGPIVAALNAEDDHRRYTVDSQILIKTRAGRALPRWWFVPPAPRRRCPRCWNSPSTIRRSTPRSARRTAMWGSWPIRAAVRRQPRSSHSLSARRRRCARGHRLDRQATLERRPRGHVRRRI